MPRVVATPARSTTIKAGMILPNTTARDQWITAAQAAVASLTLKPQRGAYAVATSSTTARLKHTLVQDEQAVSFIAALTDAGNTATALTGSFVRASREDSVVLAENYW